MERISVDVPEQPPVGSVVLDVAGTAWQLRNNGLIWWPAHSSVQANGLSWALLLCGHGPLDVVHRGEVIP